VTQPLIPNLPNPYQMKVWNLAALTVTLGGFKISRGAGASGYGPDTVIKLAQKDPDFVSVKGADGSYTVCATNQVLTEFELTVMQSNSATNGFLSTARIAAKFAGVPLVMPLVMQDQNGTTVFSAMNCWITGPPEQEMKSETSPRTWKLECSPELNYVGGNVQNASGLDLDAFYAGETISCLGVSSACETEVDSLMARAF